MTDQTARYLSTRDLDVLLVTIKAGSLINAAQQLRIPQSAILRSIANVEHALGAILLEQTPRGIEPTPHGQALINIHNVHHRRRRTDRGARTGPTREDGERRSPSRRH